MPGYTLEEKVEIAMRHLLPKQLIQHGLTANQLRVPPQVISTMASSHTREAGVRNLERKIGSVCRAAAVKVSLHVLAFLLSSLLCHLCSSLLHMHVCTYYFHTYRHVQYIVHVCTCTCM